MPSIGPTEILLVLVIALFVVGPKRLPELGRSIGRSIRAFRTAAGEASKELGVEELADDVKELRRFSHRRGLDVQRALGLDELERDLQGAGEAAAGEDATGETKAGAQAAEEQPAAGPAQT